MNEQIDLLYFEDSFAPGYDAKQLKEFEEWISDTRSSAIHLDSDYIAHIAKFHGGKPRKRYFRTSKGTEHVVERLLNFIPFDYPELSALDTYRVEACLDNIADRISVHQFPFACLFGGDYLLFDYEHKGPPKIVAWFHEESREKLPYVEHVADNWQGFLLCLSSE